MLADAKDRHDVGVVQLGGGPRLALEPPAGLGVAEHVRRQYFQGQVPAERDLFGLVDDAHAAATDFAEHPVVAELRQRNRRGRGAGTGWVAFE